MKATHIFETCSKLSTESETEVELRWGDIQNETSSIECLKNMFQNRFGYNIESEQLLRHEKKICLSFNYCFYLFVLH